MKKIFLFLMAFTCLFVLFSCDEPGLTENPTVEVEKYTVTFDTNGGSSIDSVEIEKGGRVSIPKAPTKEGASFEGWFKDKELTTRWNFNKDTIVANTTLYAKWGEEELIKPEESLGFTIHYQRSDEAYTSWGLWLWPKDGEGALYEFNGKDDFGVYFQATWEDFGVANLEKTQLGFIVRELGDWIKDVDSDRFMNFASMEYAADGYYHIYLLTGDKEIYTSADGEVNEMIIFFGYTYNTVLNEIKISFQTNKEYGDFVIKQGNTVIIDSEKAVDNPQVTKKAKIFQYNLGSQLPDLNEKVTLEVGFLESEKKLTATADTSALYGTKAFENLYAYDGELGAIYTKSSTTFRVWSPISTDVRLRVYSNGTPANLGGDNNYREYPMKKGEKGTWEYTENGDLAGKYYTYFVMNNTYPTGREVVDPYAKSTGINGLRGMVVDFSLTNPEGWDDVKVHETNQTSLTVYETHIADLTSSTTWGGTAAKAKLFTGFYESGTTYSEGGKTVSTGFDHIKELGVNAVQLLPIFDQANDERNKTFNWGYNPLNYNALDGIYSSDPYDGYTKIKEFKQLVQAYNEAGINIIMDVVYNHTASLNGTNFDVLMPGYYFRYNNGVPSNGSGCGNETASDKYMFRKFMIDSTEFWASEYKLGGFRFDLMAIHDVETMNQLAANLHENVSEYVAVYGEPWGGGSIAMPSGFTSASQAAMNQYKGYGCFNDQMRDALIKGGMSGNAEKGWITNNSSINTADLSKIENGIRGLVLSGNTKYEPEKAIQYVTCHDNYTLYDRIKAAGITDEATVKKMAMLANSVVFTTQGVSFMLAGEEFLRTKGGDHNSYQSSYKVNELDYALKVKNIDMFENYQKLIALKQNGNILGLNGEAAKVIKINSNSDGSLIWFDLVDASTNTTYRIIHSNGVSKATKTVDLSGFELYLDTLNSNVTLSATTQIQAYQTIIATKKA